MNDQVLLRVLNRLAKWRSVFAGWQLGTRRNDDPECCAVRDHREVTIFLRAETSALLKVLLDKKVCTVEEFQAQLVEEAELLSKDYESKFTGFEATDDGMKIDVEKAGKTTRNWRP